MSIVRWAVLLSGLALLLFGGFLVWWQISAEVAVLAQPASTGPCKNFEQCTAEITSSGVRFATRNTGVLVMVLGAFLEIVALTAFWRRKSL